MEDLLRIAVVLALVGANALFVAAEYAVVAARRAALSTRADSGSSRARAALRLMDDPVRVISTVQVGITALGILTGAIGEPLVAEVVGDGLPTWASFTLSFGIVTYLSVVLGELVPKALTLDRAETILLLLARPVELLALLLRPAVWLLDRSAATILRPFGVDRVIAGESIRSTEELRAAVDEAETAGVIPERQETLLHNVIDFAERDVRDVMVPAAEVAWLDGDRTVEHALDRIVAEPHSRYPVASGSLDQLSGVVHIREIIAAARSDAATAVAAVARPAYIVPERKRLGELLEELRAGRHQLAVIVDEYGGFVGIATIEDIIESLVGDIYDEYDTPDDEMARDQDGSLLVKGAVPLAEVGRELGQAISSSGAHTIGGVVFEALGRRPVAGDSVDLGTVRAEVVEVDGNRIERLKLVSQSDQEAEGQDR